MTFLALPAVFCSEAAQELRDRATRIRQAYPAMGSPMRERLDRAASAFEAAAALLALEGEALRQEARAPADG